MASTNNPKRGDEIYAYAKLSSAATDAISDGGDLYEIRATGTTSFDYQAGTETDGSAASDNIYVVALDGCKAATTIELNGEDTPDDVTFSAGDPAGTVKVASTLTGAIALASGSISSGTAGERFAVLMDPGLSSSDTELKYIQSASETENDPEHVAVYDTKGRLAADKVNVRTESNTLSITEKFAAYDQGLGGFKGKLFNLVFFRDENRLGTATSKSETTYYWGCFFNKYPPEESTGDTDTQVTTEIRYLFKGVKR